MKKETEGYFVIKFKNKETYIFDSCFYANLIEDAKHFETRAKAYEYMKRYSLDKECVIVKIKSKKGYQPMRTTVKPIPPNTVSNVHMKKDGYTWEDLDKSYWEGFNNAKKNKMEKAD